MKLTMRKVVMTVSLAAAASCLAGISRAENLLLPNQARVENAAVAKIQFTSIGNAKYELSEEPKPPEGSRSLGVRHGGSKGSEYGVSTIVSTKQRTYLYEKKDASEADKVSFESTPFPAGPYTFSVSCAGEGYVTLGMSTDTQEGDCQDFEITTKKWSRLAVTLTAKKPFTEITLFATADTAPGYRTYFFLDQLQLEKGDKATEFNAPPLRKERPAITGDSFLPKANERIVCLGDSMTDWTPGYVAVLRERVAAKYPDLRLSVIRRGVGGNFYSTLLARAPKDVVALEPDWVLINAGLNDAGHKIPIEETRKSLESLVKLLRDSTMAQLVLIEASPFSGPADNDLNKRLSPINQVVREVAKQNNLLLVPLEDVIRKAEAKGERIYYNNPHFNQSGFAIMADSILSAMNY